MVHSAAGAATSRSVLLGGEERTGSEYRALLAEAGFAVERVVATSTPLVIFESVTP